MGNSCSVCSTVNRSSANVKDDRSSANVKDDRSSDNVKYIDTKFASPHSAKKEYVKLEEEQEHIPE